MASKPTISELVESEEELEPETLQQLYPDLNSVDRQKVLALRLMRHTAAPWVDFDVFENTCLIVNNIEPRVGQTQGCQPWHIWKLLEMARRVFDGELPEISDEVKEYIKFIHIDNGFQFFPPNIGIDNPKLEEIKQKAETGPFPLGEDPIEIQAAKYLKIQQYLKR